MLTHVGKCRHVHAGAGRCPTARAGGELGAISHPRGTCAQRRGISPNHCSGIFRMGGFGVTAEMISFSFNIGKAIANQMSRRDSEIAKGHLRMSRTILVAFARAKHTF